MPSHLSGLFLCLVRDLRTRLSFPARRPSAGKVSDRCELAYRRTRTGRSLVRGRRFFEIESETTKLSRHVDRFRAGARAERLHGD
jgi:hypothetical protein